MKREYVYRAVIVVFSSAIAIATCELVYRFITQSANVYSGAPTPDQYDFYSYDSRLGWANKPGMSGVFRRAEFSYRISLNDLGMRQKAVSKEKVAGTFRIIALGDSFLWGIGVSDDERVSEVLQRKLNGVEILNLGVSGYAPIQYSLMTERVLGLGPDLVIILFCLSNDFADNVLFQRYGYYKPYAELDANGGIVIRGLPPPNVKKFGFATAPGNTLGGFRLLGDAQSILRYLAIGQQGLIGFDSELIYADDQDLNIDERQLKHNVILINELLLRKLARDLAEHGIPLIVVPVPTKREYSRDWSYGHNGYFFQAETVLRETCERLGLPFVETVSSLTGYDFWKQDGHWKPAGHEKMASTIASFLRKHHLVPSEQKR